MKTPVFPSLWCLYWCHGLLFFRRFSPPGTWFLSDYGAFCHFLQKDWASLGTSWAGFVTQTWQPWLTLYFPSTFRRKMIFYTVFPELFPWHQALYCSLLGLCLWHSSSQTLNFYCNLLYFFFSIFPAVASSTYQPAVKSCFFIPSGCTEINIHPHHSDRQKWQPVPANTVESKHRGTCQRPPRPEQSNQTLNLCHSS